MTLVADPPTTASEAKPETFGTRSCGHRVPVNRVACPYCKPPRLSVQPLQELLRGQVQRHGLTKVSVEVATRLGTNPDHVQRYISRVLQGKFRKVELQTADNYAVALGSMPAILWQREWDYANPIEDEPYGDEEFD